MYCLAHSIKTVSRKADFAFPSCKYRYCSKASLLSFSNVSRLTINPDSWRLINIASLIAKSVCRLLNVALVLRGSRRKSSYRSCVIGIVLNSSANRLFRYNSAAKDSKTREHTVKSPISLPWTFARLAAFSVFVPLLNDSPD